jgi:hypothetical protein
MTFTGNFVYLYLAKNRANLMLRVALLYIYTHIMLLALTEGNQSIESFQGSPSQVWHKPSHLLPYPVSESNTV